MTYAESNYLGSAIAANNQASFTFSYLDVSEIRVDITVSGTTTTYTTSSNPAGFTITSPNQYVTLSNHPADSDAIRIYRITDLDNTRATFVAGSAISANDLNNNSKQVLQASQESRLESDTAVTTANSAATDAATAISTANSATTTANSAVTTANTANTNATAAQTAATNAAASATAAQTSATAAQTSATAAQTSATSAQNSATAAASDAASALSTANTANTNASAAVTTANTASTTASSAVTTANTANTNASAAQTAASNAATDASNAQTSATAAQTSATSAQTSATAAAASAAASQNVADAFTATGTPATALSVDVPIDAANGVKLPTNSNSYDEEGAIRYNTTLDKIEIRKGSGWSTAAGGASVSSTPPSLATAGDVWYDHDNGRAYVYYNDGDSNQWVEMNPSWNGYVSDNSVTSAKIVDGTIVNADINASAAIAGTKITPNFGSQNVLTTGNVGIGESSPSAGLHVVRDVNPVLKLDRGTANTANANWYYNGTLTGQVSAANADFQLSAAGASTPMSFYVNGSQRMRIDSSGRVGIGNNSPSTLGTGRLVVGQGAGSETITIFSSTSSNGNIHFADGTTGSDRYRGYLSYDHPTNSMQFGTNDTERMRINSSGYVGIGYSDPNVILTLNTSGVNSLIGFRQNGTTEGYIGTSGYSANGVITGASFGDLGIRAENRNINFSVNGGVGMAARIDTNGRLLVGTTTEGYSGADTLTIAESGACGLTIRSGSTVNGTIAFSDATSGTAEYAGYIQYSHGYNVLGFGVQSAERMRITASGHTKMSNAATYVNASGLYHEFYNSASNNATLVLRSTGTSGQQYGLSIGTANDQNNTTNYLIAAYGAGTNRFIVKSNGGIHNYSGNNVNLCDEREKKNIEVLDSTWGCLKNWELKKFHYNEDADTEDKRYGVIAQQVAPHCPELITNWIKQEAKDAELDDDGNVVTPAQEEIARLGVKEQQMTWMAIKALQEAMERIETLETQNADLAARITALETN